MRFHATIALHGKSATGIEVPSDVVAALGQGKRPKVTVTINGYSYPSTVGVMGGVSLIPVSADVRAKAGVAAGDEVDIDLVPDTGPRTVEVPASGTSVEVEGRSHLVKVLDVVGVQNRNSVRYHRRGCATSLK